MRRLPDSNGTRQRQAHAASGSVHGPFLRTASRSRPSAASTALRHSVTVTQTYRIHLFAKLRDVFATDVFDAEMPVAAAVGELRQMLMNRQPTVAALLERSRIAVNGEFAEETTKLNPGDEIAIIPP